MVEAQVDADPHCTAAGPPADGPHADDPDPSHTGRAAVRAQLAIALRTAAIVAAAMAVHPLLPGPLGPAAPALLAAAALAHVRRAERSERPGPWTARTDGAARVPGGPRPRARPRRVRRRAERQGREDRAARAVDAR